MTVKKKNPIKKPKKTNTQDRRKITTDFKVKVLKAIDDGASVLGTARKFNVHPTMIYAWKKKDFTAEAPTSPKPEVVPAAPAPSLMAPKLTTPKLATAKPTKAKPTTKPTVKAKPVVKKPTTKPTKARLHAHIAQASRATNKEVNRVELMTMVHTFIASANANMKAIESILATLEGK